MSYQTIIYEKKGNVAVVTLNRPDKLNSINVQMRNELIEAFTEVDTDKDVRAMVLTGAGRAFCAGGDVAEMVGGEEDGSGGSIRDTELYQALSGRDARVIQKLYNVEKPTIAMVNGVAVGAGFAISLACDLRVGSEKTRFMNAFVRVGLSPGWGSTWLYIKIMGLSKALEYLYTGDFIEAPEAEKLGVLNRLVPIDDLESETMALAGKIAAGPPQAIMLAKLQSREALKLDFDVAVRMSIADEAFTVGSADHEEGVTAFREKRQAEFRGN